MDEIEEHLREYERLRQYADRLWEGFLGRLSVDPNPRDLEKHMQSGSFQRWADAQKAASDYYDNHLGINAQAKKG